MVSVVVDGTPSTIATMLYVCAYAAVAVNVHRQILLTTEESRIRPKFEVFLNYVVWGFAVILLGIACVIPSQALNAGESDGISAVGAVGLFVGIVAALYVSSRASLILPERALGRELDFRSIWNLSTGNGWKLTGALLLPPFVVNIAIAVLTVPLEGKASDVASAVLAAPLLVLEIALLSVAYEHFRANHAAT